VFKGLSLSVLQAIFKYFASGMQEKFPLTSPAP